MKEIDKSRDRAVKLVGIVHPTQLGQLGDCIVDFLLLSGAGLFAPPALFQYLAATRGGLDPGTGVWSAESAVESGECHGCRDVEWAHGFEEQMARLGGGS